jgi:hypothetical protein
MLKSYLDAGGCHSHKYLSSADAADTFVEPPSSSSFHLYPFRNLLRLKSSSSYLLLITSLVASDGLASFLLG